MTRPTCSVRVTISKAELFAALVALVDATDFDHRQWSAYESQELIRCGEKIAKTATDAIEANPPVPGGESQ